ncbi:hypothetical protein [Lichenicoccus sp.]|uniref:hypothetical protein n=1 Tax=Lichenicoccus sp. TaxID=2781899 RepID=UPI003D0F3523
MARGADDAAKAAYLDVLQLQPTHCQALVELGALALASGHRSAARAAWRQAALHHPSSALAQTAFGNLLIEDGDSDAGRMRFAQALASAPDYAPAHQGMARLLEAAGDAAAAAQARQRGFTGHAIGRRRYRGTGEGIALLLLVSARGGNVPVRHWIDDRLYAVTTLCPEFHPEGMKLPPHRLVINAIGDAELCGAALAAAGRLLAAARAPGIDAAMARPVLNPPQRVRLTGRLDNASRLARIEGVIAPRMLHLPRASIAAAEALGYPLLLRVPGLHTGQHCVRVASHAALAPAAAALPGDDLLAIGCLDARSPDGLWRKYRVMVIGGALYPLHLAISAQWKVHYFTAAMADDAGHRAEEHRFLLDMPGCIGARAMVALAGIAAALGLDYAGIDFALAADGSVLLFEANATMVINPPEPDMIWDYRRPAIAAALAAAAGLVAAACAHVADLGGAG